MTIDKESTMIGSFARVARARDASRGRLGLLALLALATVLAFASPAAAEFGVTSFRAGAERADGSEETRAGAHPFAARVDFRLRTFTDSVGEFADGNMKTVVTDLPVGFVGSPAALPTCSRAQLLGSSCPVASQVGVITLYNVWGVPTTETSGVYNLEPRKGEVADFGFQILNVPQHIKISLRDGDYGVRATIENVPQMVPAYGAKLTLWGVPGDPVHDGQRGTSFYCQTDQDDPACSGPGVGGGFPAGVTARPFLTNPTYCGDPLETRISIDSWRNPGSFVSASSTTTSGVTDCGNLTFEPKLTLRPDTTQTDASTGLTVDLEIPQATGLNNVATPTLRRADVQLPAGMSINPSGADKLTGCTDAQIKLGTKQTVECPESSKIGDVTIRSPLLDEELSGPIWLGEPLPGKRYRIFLNADNEGYGISVRLEGILHLDPVTGRITTVFDELPQLPFDKLTLRFKGGPRAPLATAQTCGTSETFSKLTPWAAQDAQPSTWTDPVNFSWDGNGAGCPPAPVASLFRGGTANPVAGADSPFNITFGRNDREQNLKNIDMKLPPGLLGRISSVPLCDEGAANAGSCGTASQIGNTTVASGAGASPIYLGGRVFLTGGYKGGAYGLSIVVPAKAGPYDLGTVVVRAAIHVDRTDAHLRIVSDDFPSILDGIPLRMKTVSVAIDRPGFMFNPTSCSPMNLGAQIGGLQGGVANLGSRFQVAGCKSLPFKPKLTIRMGARGRTKASSTAPLDVSLAMTPGQANNRAVTVSLPRNVNARLAVINQRACTIQQFKSETCPQSDRIGTATAITPLLRAPLRGDVFFVRNPARRIPDLMVALRGEVAIDLTGKVTVNRNLTLRTEFDTIPDVPITRFDLNLVAGRNGPVGFVANACTKAARAERAGIRFRSHSGRVISAKQKMTIVGCGKATTRKASKKSTKKSTQKAAGKK